MRRIINWPLLHILVIIFLLGVTSTTQSQPFTVQSFSPTSVSNTDEVVSLPDANENLEIQKIDDSRTIIQLFGMGVFFGIILILLVYSFLVYFNVKQPVFLWFFVYVLTVSIQIFLVSGSIFSVESSFYYQISTINSLVIFAGYKRFFQLLLNTKELYTAQDKWLKIILVITAILTILYFIIPNSMLIISIRGFFLIAIIITVFSTRKNTELTSFQSVLILISLVFLILSGLFLTLNEWDESMMSLLNLRFGIVFMTLHILLFSVSILYRVKRLSEMRELLWQDIRQSKKELLESYLLGVEEERTRIVDELEHSVITDIDTLKESLQMDKGLDTETQIELQKIQDDVKNISVQIEGKKKSNNQFIKKIQSLINEHQTEETKFIFDLFNFSDGVDSIIETNLYNIIQEAIQNIEKYAKASKVEIQIIQNEKELILSIEDNGVGFDSKNKTDGIGLVNMRHRVAKINGTFNLSTSPGNGVSIIVVISFNK